MSAHRYLTWLLIFIPILVMGQYNMQNATVQDCEGTLLDSEDGLIAGTYAHNENFVFTICPPGVTSINISFASFCTELNYDFLTIHDGPDTLSPIISGPTSGLIPPSPVTSTGCVTIHFTSDANIACTGFELNWIANITQPLPPNITLSPATVTCSTTVLTLTLDQLIHCDSVYDSAFTITGPIGQSISSKALNCINDSTDEIELTFSPGLNRSGTYTINFTSYFRDVCDSLWELTATVTFVINDCPLELELFATDTIICPGMCTDIWAVV
ncbi:MAG: CUB domain-containing protein, partial [Bacteroidetes bacterium]|nr:CUB domain-containing protein [Bacteroidota bacterium]